MNILFVHWPLHVVYLIHITFWKLKFLVVTPIFTLLLVVEA
jgi:hypothetical protein